MLFDQLICQRLQRGYQIVLLPKEMIHSAIRKILPGQARQQNISRECSLSFNHIYHRICLIELDLPYILLQQFLPKSLLSDDKNQAKATKYNYLFQVPDDSTYMASTTAYVPHTGIISFTRANFRFKHHNLDKLNCEFCSKFN